MPSSPKESHFKSFLKSDRVCSLMLGSVETNMKAQFLPSWLASLRVEKRVLPNWREMDSCDPFCAGFSARRVVDLGPARRLSLQWPGLGLFPIRTERQCLLVPQ